MQGIGYCYFPFSYGKRIRVTGQACGIPEPLSYRDGAMAEKGDGGRRISEQIFGTNVLKIAVCIYTNKLLYGIIPKQKGVVSAFDSMCAGAHCFGLFEVLSPMR